MTVITAQVIDKLMSDSESCQHVCIVWTLKATEIKPSPRAFIAVLSAVL